MKMNKILSLLTAFALFAVCGFATAKSECGADPFKPGACFVPGPISSDGVIVCDNEGVIEAVAFGGPVDPKRRFVRVNPNGTIAAHSTIDVIGAGACNFSIYGPELCGVPEAPGPATFLGSASVQVNGFITPEGLALCPFKLTVKGMGTRGGNEFFPEQEMVEFDAVLHNVKDKKTGGCRIKECRIFAR